jgi:nickel/cobalt transporter (NiCoT) family protein
MILVLPFMFTCGMVLIDTTDGVAMRLAYGWAFINPIRKIYYNLTVTIISVLVALAIGTVELLQVVASELNLTGAFWNWLAALDFETIGFLIIIIFVASWLISLGYWKYRRFDEKYAPNLARSNASGERRIENRCKVFPLLHPIGRKTECRLSTFFELPYPMSVSLFRRLSPSAKSSQLL